MFPGSKMGKFSQLSPEKHRRTSGGILGMCFEIRIPLAANKKKPLRFSSQNINFDPEELLGDSWKRYVYPSFHFQNTFLQFSERLRRLSVKHATTNSKIRCLYCSLQFGFRVWRRWNFLLRELVQLGFWWSQFVSVCS